jgi:hypothetical protein
MLKTYVGDDLRERLAKIVLYPELLMDIYASGLAIIPLPTRNAVQANLVFRNIVYKEWRWFWICGLARSLAKRMLRRESS